jgi:hypothetical protein
LGKAKEEAQGQTKEEPVTAGGRYRFFASHSGFVEQHYKAGTLAASSRFTPERKLQTFCSD